MVSAAADKKGVGGTQIWVHKDDAKQQPSIIYAGPQILAASWRSKSGQDIGAVSGHAPYEAAPEQLKQTFWKDLDLAVASLRGSLRRDALVFCLLDANAKVGSIPSQSLGTVGADEENDNGGRLRIFLEGQGMIALNTLTADAADKTWSDSSGHGHRIDYVCTDAALADHIVRAGVLQSIDLATAERSDHNAVVGEVRVPSRPAKTDKSGEPKVSNEIPPLKIDVNKTKEAWRAEGFAAELQQSYDESHRWMTEGATEWKSPLGIDERISKWMAETRRLAAAWFPRERAQPRKKWLSEEAWTTVRQIDGSPKDRA